MIERNSPSILLHSYRYSTRTFRNVHMQRTDDLTSQQFGIHWPLPRIRQMLSRLNALWRDTVYTVYMRRGNYYGSTESIDFDINRVPFFRPICLVVFVMRMKFNFGHRDSFYFCIGLIEWRDTGMQNESIKNLKV